MKGIRDWALGIRGEEFLIFPNPQCLMPNACYSGAHHG